MRLTPLRSNIFHKTHQCSQPRKNVRISDFTMKVGSSIFLWSFCQIQQNSLEDTTSNCSMVMPRSSVFGIRIGGVVLKGEKFARTWKLEEWKDVGTPTKFQEEGNMPTVRETLFVLCVATAKCKNMPKQSKTCLSCFSNQNPPGFYQNIVPGKPVVGWIERFLKVGNQNRDPFWILTNLDVTQVPGHYHSIDLSFTHLVLIPFSLEQSQNLSNFQANHIAPRQATNSPLNSLSFCCGSSLWGPQESKALPCHASLCNLSDLVRNRLKAEGRTHDAYTDYRATLKMMEATWSNLKQLRVAHQMFSSSSVKVTPHRTALTKSFFSLANWSRFPNSYAPATSHVG